MKAIVVALICLQACLAASLPTLNIGGFSWAENLAFDGLGGLFVSESVRGELWRIAYNPANQNYTANIHVSRGFKQFGGLAPVSNGQKIYAAAVFDDKTNGIIATSTTPAKVGEQSYDVVIHSMPYLANGMALVSSENALYCTAEAGTLSRVDIATGVETIISSNLDSPDGLWYDEASQKLFIGLLTTKEMIVYDISTKTFSAPFAGASSLGKSHMMDDLTVVNGVDQSNLGNTMMVACDWTGKQIVELRLNGEELKVVPLPAGVTELYQATSVRRGKGPGFDSNSFYITEGGGLTARETSRRVLQLTPGAVV
jgi:sugar lactone lactonase YvrE